MYNDQTRWSDGKAGVGSCVGAAVDIPSARAPQALCRCPPHCPSRAAGGSGARRPPALARLLLPLKRPLCCWPPARTAQKAAPLLTSRRVGEPASHWLQRPWTARHGVGCRARPLRLAALQFGQSLGAWPWRKQLASVSESRVWQLGVRPRLHGRMAAPNSAAPARLSGWMAAAARRQLVLRGRRHRLGGWSQIRRWVAAGLPLGCRWVACRRLVAG
jgi:hypothetical protein